MTNIHSLMTNIHSLMTNIHTLMTNIHSLMTNIHSLMTNIHSLVALVRFFTHILTRFILAPTSLNGSHSLLLRVICCVRYGNLNEERGQECKWVGKQEEVISLHSISVSQHFVSVGSIQHFQRKCHVFHVTEFDFSSDQLPDLLID
jgi:hypothetical protein